MKHPDPERLAGFDRLAAEERRELLGHVGSCRSCREAWLAGDPSRVFSLLRLAALPDEALERLSARVAGEIRGGSSRKRRGLVGAAALAASLLLGVWFGGYLFDGRPGTDAPTATDPGTLSAEGLPEEGTGVAGLPDPAAREPVHSVELLDSPGSGQLVNLTVGETRVVMIFDKALDI